MPKDDLKKPLTPFQRFVSAIARVPKVEADRVEDRERPEKADKPKRKSA